MALLRIAFVLDGPLAAFSTIAALQPGVLRELDRIDRLLSPGRLLVMSAVKTGAFVQHFSELDETPAPDSRIPRGTAFLPNDDYIRENIIARTTDQPWGQITYFGRPLVVKTHDGQRLFLNLAQPEADPPLTNAPRPVVLNEAIATAARLGIGRHEFLPLRRAHAKAAIPLWIGTAAVRWWTKRGLLHPPQTDPVAFLADRIRWRYAFGIPDLAHSCTSLGDARKELEEMSSQNVRLLITSPPYHGVTDYWNDQWIRLWLLGGDMRKNWKQTQKHSNLAAYRGLISDVFARTRRHVREDGVVIVRCGDKPTTADTCRKAIRSAWPSWEIFERRTKVRRRGTASGHGHGAKVIHEKDIVAASQDLADKARSWADKSSNLQDRESNKS